MVRSQSKVVLQGRVWETGCRNGDSKGQICHQRPRAPDCSVLNQNLYYKAESGRQGAELEIPGARSATGGPELQIGPFSIKSCTTRPSLGDKAQNWRFQGPDLPQEVSINSQSTGRGNTFEASKDPPRPPKQSINSQSTGRGSTFEAPEDPPRPAHLKTYHLKPERPRMGPYL